eukprot:PhM_4_TR1736/c0_g1_i1/m.86881
MANADLWKALSIGIFLIVANAFGLAPLLYRSKLMQARGLNPIYLKFMGIVNAFAGGVFLSLGVFHVLPEASEGLSKHYGEDDNHKRAFRFRFWRCHGMSRDVTGCHLLE